MPSSSTPRTRTNNPSTSSPTNIPCSSADIDTYVQHIRAVKPPYDCPVCSKRMMSQPAILTHLKTKHDYDPTLRAKDSSASLKANQPISVEIEGKVHSIPPDTVFEIAYKTKKDKQKTSAQQNDKLKLPEMPGWSEDSNYYKKRKRFPFVANSDYIEYHSEPDEANITSPRAANGKGGRIKKTPEVEYDIEEDDIRWLDIKNEERSKKNMPEVSVNTFEFCFDRLEREAVLQLNPNAFPPHNLGHPPDDDTVCCVCNDGEADDTNQILFCDLCNVAVHQECYGSPFIPEGAWMCRRCQLSPATAVSCRLCPNTGGAFKQTIDNQWVHVICALWVPEVRFANPIFLEPVDNFERIPPSRWNLTCFICKLRGATNGACIQCYKPTCYTAFHVTCAQNAGLYMNMELPEDEEVTGGRNDMVRKTVYCDKHEPPKEGLTKEEAAEAEHRRVQMFRRARRLTITETQRGQPRCIGTFICPEDKFEEIKKKVQDFPGKDVFMREIRAYWILKRADNRGMPLLRNLKVANYKIIGSPAQKATVEKAAGDKQRRRRERKRKAKVEVDEQTRETAAQAKSLREQVEQARLLLEQLRKRERQKRTLVNVIGKSLDLLLKPLASFMVSFVELLMTKDGMKLADGTIYEVFRNPVSDQNAPGYSQVIKKPMDLSKMRCRAASLQYISIAQIRADFDLMVSNCTSFNPRGDQFHAHALKMRDSCSKIFAQYEKIDLASIYDLKTGMHKKNKEATKLVLNDLIGAFKLGQPDRWPKITLEDAAASPSKRSCREEQKKEETPSPEKKQQQAKRDRARSLVNRSSELLRKRATETPTPRPASRSRKSQLARKPSLSSDDEPLAGLMSGKRTRNSLPQSPAAPKRESFRVPRDYAAVQSPAMPETPAMPLPLEEDDEGVQENDDQLSYTTTDTSLTVQSVNASFIAHKHLDIIWGQVKGCPWYPALVVDPDDHSPQTFELPKPPSKVMSMAKPNQTLVWFFDEKRNWGWLSKDMIDPLGFDPDLDQAKLNTKKPKDRQLVHRAYCKALIFRCSLQGTDLPEVVTATLTEEEVEKIKPI